MLSWVVLPVFDNWRRSALLIAFLIMLIVVVYFASQSIYLTLLSVFFLVGALYKYFVAQPSRLENFRGVYVRFGNNKGAVIDFVKQQIPLSVESTDTI